MYYLSSHLRTPPQFDRADFPSHFDAWEEFHSDVEMNALGDEAGRHWKE